MRINIRNIEALRAPESGYTLFWDDTLPGFGVRITSAGFISYIVERRIKGRKRRITLGRYTDLKPEQARKKAERYIGEIASDGDPVATRAREKLEQTTLKEVFQAYLKARKELKPLTVKDMERAMDEAFSDWLEKPILRITRAKIERRHESLGKRSKARANLAMRYLRALFNFAMDTYQDSEGKSVVTDNPVRALKKAWYPVERRRTVIKPHQLKAWWQAVEALDNRMIADYFKFVLLTGLRRSEALALRWADVDLEDRTITLRDTKNREDHTLPLSDYLVDLLEGRRGTIQRRYVFESRRGRLQNIRYAQDEVISKSGVSFTLHDLRRTFATIAERLDVSAYSLKRLLNHKMGGDVTAGYVVTDVERLRIPMQAITDYVLKAVGEKETAEVIELAQQAR